MRFGANDYCKVRSLNMREIYPYTSNSGNLEDVGLNSTMVGMSGSVFRCNTNVDGQRNLYRVHGNTYNWTNTMIEDWFIRIGKRDEFILFSRMIDGRQVIIRIANLKIDADVSTPFAKLIDAAITASRANPCTMDLKVRKAPIDDKMVFETSYKMGNGVNIDGVIISVTGVDKRSDTTLPLFPMNSPVLKSNLTLEPSVSVNTRYFPTFSLLAIFISFIYLQMRWASRNIMYRQ